MDPEESAPLLGSGAGCVRAGTVDVRERLAGLPAAE